MVAMTFQSREAKRRAVAAPIPDEQPVSKTVFFIAPILMP